MEKFPVNKRRLREALRFVPALGLAYLNNPKVACTSIKIALWRRSDALTGTETFDGVNRHSIDHGPWRDLLTCDPDMLQNATFFTVVRDPHARLLSAYLSKRDHPQESLFRWCGRHIGGMPDTFPEFIRRIVTVPEHERERHIRPQWINVLWPYVRFDFVGRIEEIGEVKAFFAQHQFHLPISNRTGAATKIDEYYDSETRELVALAYADDFKLWRGQLPLPEKTTIVDLLHGT
jgi:hypothetical protein